MLIHWKHHLPYEITQHYLPPNTSECTCLKAGHYSICLPWRDNRLRWPVFSQCCNHGLCGSNNPVTPSCDHNDFKSPTIAVSRSVVAAQLPSCDHTKPQIAKDCSVFALYAKRESSDCTKTLQRLYCDCTAFAVWSLIEAVCSFCDRITNCVVAVAIHSCDRRLSADQVQ